jgi:Mg2+ and Co2+ transporter CorA
MTDMHAAVARELRRVNLPDGPFAPRMVCAFLRAVLSRYEDFSNQLEQELRRMERLPTRESSPGFFEEATDLKRELSSAKADLWRLKRVLDVLVEKLVESKRFGPDQVEFLRRLAKDAEFLHETVDQNREGAISVIDLHLNIVSFDMNRFMRLLAAVSLLGLIPAVVGGLFGMNLAGNPWPFTLPQVTFGVSMLMLVCLYIFLIKGWLR